MLYNIFWRLATIDNCYYLCRRVGYHRNGEDRRCNVSQRSAGGEPTKHGWRATSPSSMGRGRQELTRQSSNKYKKQ